MCYKSHFILLRFFNKFFIPFNDGSEAKHTSTHLSMPKVLGLANTELVSRDFCMASHWLDMNRLALYPTFSVIFLSIALPREPAIVRTFGLDS